MVKIGLIQWEMCFENDLVSFLQKIEEELAYFSKMQTDFVLFPELFSANLLPKHSIEEAAKKMRDLAEQTPFIVEKLSAFSKTYNLHLIGGGLPTLENNILYNKGFIYSPEGIKKEYAKLHITPSEKKTWGMEGGDSLPTFSTKQGKIGVLICYDSEFPELGRIVAEKEIDILFVPYWTTTKAGYYRVRKCAEARAIENECFVAITGSFGNRKGVAMFENQYSKSAVFAPCDSSFYSDGIVDEGMENKAARLLVSCDMKELNRVRKEGEVHNLKDRRTDLYQLVNKM